MAKIFPNLRNSFLIMLDNFALSLEIHILLLFTGLFQNMVLVKKQSKTLQHVQSESMLAK